MRNYQVVVFILGITLLIGFVALIFGPSLFPVSTPDYCEILDAEPLKGSKNRVVIRLSCGWEEKKVNFQTTQEVWAKAKMNIEKTIICQKQHGLFPFTWHWKCHLGGRGRVNIFEPFIKFFEPFIDFVMTPHIRWGDGNILIFPDSPADAWGHYVYLIVALYVLAVLVIKGKEVVSYLWDKWGF